MAEDSHPTKLSVICTLELCRRYFPHLNIMIQKRLLQKCLLRNQIGSDNDSVSRRIIKRLIIRLLYTSGWSC